MILKRHTWSMKRGFFATLFLMWYGISRFVADFFRADDLPISDNRWLGLTLNQYAAFAMLGIGLYLNHNYKVINLGSKKNEKK
jgi:prolipoprotein diacylglyceryltransferase